MAVDNSARMAFRKAKWPKIERGGKFKLQLKITWRDGMISQWEQGYPSEARREQAYNHYNLRANEIAKVFGWRHRYEASYDHHAYSASD